MDLDANRKFLPIRINKKVLDGAMADASKKGVPVIGVVIATKPDFYKQAPLVSEALRRRMPVMVIDTGQHYGELLRYGITEFGLDKNIGCSMQIRGNQSEKASELMLKLGSFGAYCRKRYKNGGNILPIVHGDTLVSGIGSIGWTLGTGQKVAQNEAGLRSMAPEAIRRIRASGAPSKGEIERFVDAQLNGKWFLAREEPFPEQLSTWVSSAGAKYFFAATRLNRDNLVREGYPEDDIFQVGNSVVDAVAQKRREKLDRSVFDVYPKLESGEWIRVDVHRRENMTEHRFRAIVGALKRLLAETDRKFVIIMLNATKAAIESYGLGKEIAQLKERYPGRLMVTPVWKEYAHVIEFLDSGHCSVEFTDSGSMQEELLYFPKVMCLTARLNTDRPESIFDAKSNILVPPLSAEWVTAMVKEACREGSPLGDRLRRKKQIYGKPGTVSKKIMDALERKFASDDFSLYPWLHTRLNLWKDEKMIDYL